MWTIETSQTFQFISTKWISYNYIVVSDVAFRTVWSLSVIVCHCSVTPFGSLSPSVGPSVTPFGSRSPSVGPSVTPFGSRSPSVGPSVTPLARESLWKLHGSRSLTVVLRYEPSHFTICTSQSTPNCNRHSHRLNFFF